MGVSGVRIRRVRLCEDQRAAVHERECADAGDAPRAIHRLRRHRPVALDRAVAIASKACREDDACPRGRTATEVLVDHRPERAGRSDRWGRETGQRQHCRTERHERTHHVDPSSVVQRLVPGRRSVDSRLPSRTAAATSRGPVPPGTVARIRPPSASGIESPPEPARTPGARMATVAGTKPHPIYLAGQWVESSDPLEIANPAKPDEPAGATFNATPEQYEQAVTAA